MEHSSLSDIYIHDDNSKVGPCSLMTGTQAIVRFIILQHQHDHENGINTAGFISGYRGSPLGKLDIELWKADNILKQKNIIFSPGINEEMAATSLWGTQQVNMLDGAIYDGVFGVWYGKGAGVDRCGDVFRHANAAGTSKFGGVIAIAGDDHYAQSSSLASQTDHTFQALMMPVLAPSSVQEILTYGLHGIAMSRYSGCWVAMKIVSDLAESAAIVDIRLTEFKSINPPGIDPAENINIRWPDSPQEQEKRLKLYKKEAVVLYARENNINQIVMNSTNAKTGIITSGKVYLDVRQALHTLNIHESNAEKNGIKLYKVGMVWPLDNEHIIQFSHGLERIIVIEEKNSFIESQLKEILYNARSVIPEIVGKFDGENKLFSDTEKLSPLKIATILALYLRREDVDFYLTSNSIISCISYKIKEEKIIDRIPHYCSGCPHNTSTKVPENSIALAGIGCHYMAKWIYPQNKTFSQMGGEGVAWIGQSPFTHTQHVFANMGDGTYFHSGILAIRASVAAKVNITYKILYNNAVAMTGGQPLDGDLSVQRLSSQLLSEGVMYIVIVTDDKYKYKKTVNMDKRINVYHRGKLDAIQRELRVKKGVSVIIYDQTCALIKKREREKNKKLNNTMIIINEAVCEGCGDCSSKSNCMSVIPVITEYGIKRTIDYSFCNQDMSCVNGFCPSFVTIKGGGIKKDRILQNNHDTHWSLPEPQKLHITSPYNILIAGIGGAGITTLSSLISMAAFIDGMGVLTLDMTGLAQKNGAVWSHVRLAPSQEHLYSPSIDDKDTHLLLGLDIITTSFEEILCKTEKNQTNALLNLAENVTSEFVRRYATQAESGDIGMYPELYFPLDTLKTRITEHINENNSMFINFNNIVNHLVGDKKTINMFMLGFAYQKGWLPLSEKSIQLAIEKNEKNIDVNKESFLWGRRTADDIARVDSVIKNKQNSDNYIISQSLDEVVSRRIEELINYQCEKLARKYQKIVNDFIQLDEVITGSTCELSEAVARYYFKVIAIKDEYEVARLLTDNNFLKKIKDTFEGNYKVNVNLSIPLLSSLYGKNKKFHFGPWFFIVLKMIAKMKKLRNTWFDPFCHTDEHTISYQWKKTYEDILIEIMKSLNSSNYHIAVELARLPDHVRGYGQIKARYIQHAQSRKEQLLSEFRKLSS